LEEVEEGYNLLQVQEEVVVVDYILSRVLEQVDCSP
jgi:hypothetical protein